MPEANREGKRRTVGRGMLIAVLPAAALLALAHVTSARADDQAPPPPLMVAKSAVIVPDEPDATFVDDVAPPEPVSAPAPMVEQKAVATEGRELAAKPHQMRPVVHHLPQPETPSPVISAHVRVVHPVRPHHAVSKASHAVAAATSRWYQIEPRQYRHARAGKRISPRNGVSLSAQPASATQGRPSGAGPHMSRTVCAFRTGKCLQLCPSYAPYKFTQNGRWIGACNYVPVAVSRLDRLHAKLLERLWFVALNARAGVAAIQYQRLATQYQSGTSIAAPPGEGTRTTAPQPVRSRAHDVVESRHTVVGRQAVAAKDGRRIARVLAAVATHETQPVKLQPVKPVRPSSVRTAAPKAHHAAEASARAGAPSSSGDWSFRTLVLLTIVGFLAFVLAAFAQGTAPAAVLTGVRSRLGSKGLSASRVVLGDGTGERRRRGGGIAYRD